MREPDCVGGAPLICGEYLRRDRRWKPGTPGACQVLPGFSAPAVGARSCAVLGSYTSGCTGLMSLITLAAGILRAANAERVICLTADLKPPGTTYDAVREKLLTSDAASGSLSGASRRDTNCWS